MTADQDMADELLQEYLAQQKEEQRLQGRIRKKVQTLLGRNAERAWGVGELAREISKQMKEADDLVLGTIWAMLDSGELSVSAERKLRLSDEQVK